MLVPLPLKGEKTPNHLSTSHGATPLLIEEKGAGG